MNESTTKLESSASLAQAPGRSTRTAVGAVLLGLIALILGGAVSGALLFANLKLAPTIPLFLPATVLWCLAYIEVVMPRSERAGDLLKRSLCAMLLVGFGACARPELAAHGPISIGATPSEIAFVEPLQSAVPPQLCFELHPPGGSHRTSEIRVTLVTTAGEREPWLTTIADRRGEGTVCLRDGAGGSSTVGTRTYRGVELSAKVPLSVRELRWDASR